MQALFRYGMQPYSRTNKSSKGTTYSKYGPERHEVQQVGGGLNVSSFSLLPCEEEAVSLG